MISMFRAQCLDTSSPGGKRRSTVDFGGVLRRKLLLTDNPMAGQHEYATKPYGGVGRKNNGTPATLEDPSLTEEPSMTEGEDFLISTPAQPIEVEENSMDREGGGALVENDSHLLLEKQESTNVFTQKYLADSASGERDCFDSSNSFFVQKRKENKDAAAAAADPVLAEAQPTKSPRKLTRKAGFRRRNNASPLRAAFGCKSQQATASSVVAPLPCRQESSLLPERTQSFTAPAKSSSRSNLGLVLAPPQKRQPLQRSVSSCFVTPPQRTTSDNSFPILAKRTVQRATSSHHVAVVPQKCTTFVAVGGAPIAAGGTPVTRSASGITLGSPRQRRLHRAQSFQVQSSLPATTTATAATNKVPPPPPPPQLPASSPKRLTRPASPRRSAGVHRTRSCETTSSRGSTASSLGRSISSSSTTNVETREGGLAAARAATVSGGGRGVGRIRSFRAQPRTARSTTASIRSLLTRSPAATDNNNNHDSGSLTVEESSAEGTVKSSSEDRIIMPVVLSPMRKKSIVPHASLLLRPEPVRRNVSASNGFQTPRAGEKGARLVPMKNSVNANPQKTAFARITETKSEQNKEVEKKEEDKREGRPVLVRKNSVRDLMDKAEEEYNQILKDTNDSSHADRTTEVEFEYGGGTSTKKNRVAALADAPAIPSMPKNGSLRRTASEKSPQREKDSATAKAPKAPVSLSDHFFSCSQSSLIAPKSGSKHSDEAASQTQGKFSSRSWSEHMLSSFAADRMAEARRKGRSSNQSAGAAVDLEFLAASLEQYDQILQETNDSARAPRSVSLAELTQTNYDVRS